MLLHEAFPHIYKHETSRHWLSSLAPKSTITKEEDTSVVTMHMLEKEIIANRKALVNKREAFAKTDKRKSLRSENSA
jgi:hypothetical protein